MDANNTNPTKEIQEKVNSQSNTWDQEIDSKRQNAIEKLTKEIQKAEKKRERDLLKHNKKIEKFSKLIAQLEGGINAGECEQAESNGNRTLDDSQKRNHVSKSPDKGNNRTSGNKMNNPKTVMSRLKLNSLSFRKSMRPRDAEQIGSSVFWNNEKIVCKTSGGHSNASDSDRSSSASSTLSNDTARCNSVFSSRDKEPVQNCVISSW